MKNLTLIIAFILSIAFSTTTEAKRLGNYLAHYQITDKQILIETTKKESILINAFDNHAVGVTILAEDKVVSLVSPTQINLQNKLNGSIYTEEIDDQIQITSTIPDGIIIRIEKKPLRLSFIDKVKNELLFEQNQTNTFGKNSNQLSFDINEDDPIELLTNNCLEIIARPVKKGQAITPEILQKLIQPKNEICMVSSKGYGLILNANHTTDIDFSKDEMITVSENKKLSSNYMVVFGLQQPSMIEKYAFHMQAYDTQFTLR